MNMFTTVLIANRGEIACRAIRTLKRLGVTSVAVYSDADRNAPHVTEADRAVALGGDKAADSYLRIDKILEMCIRDRCRSARSKRWRRRSIGRCGSSSTC